MAALKLSQSVEKILWNTRHNCSPTLLCSRFWEFGRTQSTPEGIAPDLPRQRWDGIPGNLAFHSGSRCLIRRQSD